MYSELALYIDGKWLNGEGRKGEDVINPATGKTLAHLPHASKADLDAALAAAEKGFAVWKATSAYDRAKILRKAADLVRERHDHISKVMTQEQGKVYVESRAEVLTSADIIDWYAEEGRRTYGRVIPAGRKACASSCCRSRSASSPPSRHGISRLSPRCARSPVRWRPAASNT